MKTIAERNSKKPAIRGTVAVLAIAAAGYVAATGGLAADGRAVQTREFFYVGGQYLGKPGSEVMSGQMYVEVLRPRQVKQRHPIVFFHGNWQTATNWIGTPDGRAGWADYFLDQGYVVYLVDQPARGRSPWHSSANGALAGLSPALAESRFTAPERARLWPQAKKHTQWPGDEATKGRRGDPIFDAFYASQVESLTDTVETQTMLKAAGTALLEKIGTSSIVVTHSQAGTFGWLLADARPDRVAAIVAVEPSGPPFQDAVTGNAMNRVWGITDIAMTYDPPVSEPASLKRVRQTAPDGPDLVSCWMQAEPPRQLTKLKNIPVLVATAEASYHAGYDHCTSKYLTQAGVANSFVRLEDAGIHGNGHMMMLEKNNLAIAAFLQKWIAEHVH
jgi:pimeloyl-ACP methyl ester carboxylesterase